MTSHSSILLENPMDRGAWLATVHGGLKELDTTEWLTQYINKLCYWSSSTWTCSHIPSSSSSKSDSPTCITFAFKTFVVFQNFYQSLKADFWKENRSFPLLLRWRDIWRFDSHVCQALHSYSHHHLSRDGLIISHLTHCIICQLVTPVQAYHYILLPIISHIVNKITLGLPWRLRGLDSASTAEDTSSNPWSRN